MRIRWAGLSAVVGAAMTMASLVGVAAPAVAHPDAPAPAGGAEVVVFGDSYAANPDGWMNTLIKNGLPAPAYPRPTGCPQAPDNWPRRLAEQSGKTVSDYSCTAQTSAQARVKLDQAVADRAIGPGTRDVVAAVGFNDFGPFGAADGVNITDFAAVENHYVETMRGFVDAVRAVAPAARVTIVGTPAVGAVGGGVCVVNVIPGHPGVIPVPVENWEMATQRMQSRAAAETGAVFLDLRSRSAGHDTCTPDDRGRFISGVVDTTSPAWHMWLHPTDAGSQFIADTVAETVAGEVV